MRLFTSLCLALAVGLCAQPAAADEALSKKITETVQSCGGD